jgi:hypothetical protein
MRGAVGPRYRRFASRCSRRPRARLPDSLVPAHLLWIRLFRSDAEACRTYTCLTAGWVLTLAFARLRPDLRHARACQKERPPSLVDTVYVLERGGRIATHGSPADIFIQSELLEANRLEPPLLARLFGRLRERGCDVSAPFTLDQAVEQRCTHLSAGCNQLARMPGGRGVGYALFTRRKCHRNPTVRH